MFPVLTILKLSKLPLLLYRLEETAEPKLKKDFNFFLTRLLKHKLKNDQISSKNDQWNKNASGYGLNETKNNQDPWNKNAMNYKK